METSALAQTASCIPLVLFATLLEEGRNEQKNKKSKNEKMGSKEILL